jgi:hypothetical protein
MPTINSRFNAINNYTKQSAASPDQHDCRLSFRESGVAFAERKATIADNLLEPALEMQRATPDGSHVPGASGIYRSTTTTRFNNRVNSI